MAPEPPATSPGAEGTAPNPQCSHRSLEWGQRSTSGWMGAQGLCARLSLGNKQLPPRRLTAHICSLTGSKGQESGRSLRGPLPRVSQAAVKMPSFLKLKVPHAHVVLVKSSLFWCRTGVAFCYWLPVGDSLTSQKPPQKAPDQNPQALSHVAACSRPSGPPSDFQTPIPSHLIRPGPPGTISLPSTWSQLLRDPSYTGENAFFTFAM